jgi:hypothetical protein
MLVEFAVDILGAFVGVWLYSFVRGRTSDRSERAHRGGRARVAETPDDDPRSTASEFESTGHETRVV